MANGASGVRYKAEYNRHLRVFDPSAREQAMHFR
jgi:hypothetical protein